MNKGVVLAGGDGTRLSPSTNFVSKHLLPVYDKPMIYYPISVLMLAKIKSILIVAKDDDLPLYKKLLGNGKNFGINISYKSQNKPRGILDGLKVTKDFIGKSNFVLILGDNIFYGQGFSLILKNLMKFSTDVQLLLHEVNNPKNFGILELKKKKPLRIIEKPEKTKSNLAVTGIYFYRNSVLKTINNFKPSKRGEYEISSLNQYFLKKKKLKYYNLGRGFAWLDTGTHSSLLEASQFVEIIEKRQGYKIACLEEIAFRNKWINKTMLKKIIKKMKNSNYGKYLQKLLNKNI